ncbi:SDR family oxidoreductase [Parasphingopyxis algicola]|nr:SDR family oxidoreductase [Parasphingopyxis algicola]
MQRLSGKVAIVTGAGRGIGRAHALALAAEGAKVVVNDYGGELDGQGGSMSPAETVVSEIASSGGEAVANFDDVVSPDGGQSIVDTALEAFGRIDVLVNNAGNYRPKMIFNMPFDDWDAVVKVHLYGHFNCIRAVSGIFREQRSGRIINTASEAWLGEAAVSNYGAAKAGIVGLTRVVARDLGKYGVTCNCICPRASTRMTEGLAFDQSAEREGLSDVLSKLEPEDVSPLVAYLATEGAKDINGQVFLASGGLIALFSEPRPIKTIAKDGRWTVDEISRLVPQTLAAELENPAPAKEG